MFQNGFSVVKDILMRVGIALAAVGAVILGAPALVAGVVAAIVFAVANLVIAVKEHWTEIGTFLSGLWENIKALAGTVLYRYSALCLKPSDTCLKRSFRPFKS